MTEMDNILRDLTDSQREAVTHVDGPLLVVAGAGSGKTRVITRRVAYLAACGVPPYRIVAITFTNKAADEMKHRVEQLTGTGGARISTFHSMCARMLRQFEDLLGFSHPFTIYDRTDSLACVKSALKQLGLSDRSANPSSLLSAISHAKNEGLLPSQMEAQARSDREQRVARVYAAYERICRANNALDFDDLLLHTARLLEESDDFRAYWQSRWTHLLIDEYQDTNRSQYLIAKLLAAGHRNICATGDPDQSIYAWRGADIRNILDFQRDYPDARTVKLEENFRSTKMILLAASGIIEKNKARIKRGLWTRNEPGMPVRVVQSPTDLDEAQAILAGIRENLAEKFTCGDMAVFYRTHAQSRVIEEALRDAGIPYAILDAVEFYNRKEIKDVVAYLKGIVNPADAVSILRVINEPRRGIGDRTVQLLTQYAATHGVSINRAIEEASRIQGLPKRAAESVEAFGALMQQLRAVPRTPVVGVVRAVLKKTRYLDCLRKSEAEEDTARAENVEELVTAAAEFDEEHPGAGLEAFLQRIALVSDTDVAAGEGGQVMLMTLHSAKGLEFPIVFIAGVEEGLLPHMNSLGSQAAVEEERRLCYVGITRAKKKVYLHWAAQRYRAGQLGWGTPSRFIKEIPPEARADGRGGGAPSEQTRGTRGRRVSDGERVIEYDNDVVEYEGSILKPGDRVQHPTFGVGRVVSLSGSGAQSRAEVDFRGRTRKLMLEYTRLTRLG